MKKAIAIHEDTRGPTDERLRHADYMVHVGQDERGRATITTIADTPIERAHQRGAITDLQLAAAIIYRRHWELSGLGPHLATIDPDRIHACDFGSYGHMPKTMAQAEHRKAQREAAKAIGAMATHALEHIVCYENPLDSLGGLFYQSKSKAIEGAERFLDRTLTQLIRHFELEPPRAGRIRACITTP